MKPSALDAAREAVRKGKATAAIVIPKDFGRDAGHALFTSATKPEIGLLYDPSHNIELGMIKGILSGAVIQAASKEMFTGRSGREAVNESIAQVENNSQLPPEDRKALRDLLSGVKEWNEEQDRASASGQTELSGGLTVPYQTHEEAITSGQNVEYNGYAHSFGGMGVQFILFMGLDVGIALLTLRQTGLWQRLRAAPLSNHAAGQPDGERFVGGGIYSASSLWICADRVWHPHSGQLRRLCRSLRRILIDDCRLWTYGGRTR